MHVDRNQCRKSKNVTEAVMELRKLNKLLEFVEIICKKHQATQSQAAKESLCQERHLAEQTRCQYCETNWMKERDYRTSLEIVSKQRKSLSWSPVFQSGS